MVYRKTYHIGHNYSTRYRKFTKCSKSYYLIGAHQTRDRIDAPLSNKNVAIFDNLDLRKYYIEIDGQRYPRDSSLMNYEQSDYIEQYKDLKLFFKEYIG